jgi:hypothetical protein
MRSGTVVAVIVGILLGAGGIWLLARIKPSAFSQQPMLPPTNAPIVVRGGSVIFRSSQPWTISGNNAQTTVNAADLTGVSVDGFTAANGSTTTVAETAGESTTTPDPLQNNWRFTLVFRDQNGNDPTGPDSGKAKLKVCSDSGCTAAGKINGGTTLYLVGDGTGTFDTDNTLQLDGQYLLHYYLNACNGGPGKESKCNHVKKVNIDGISAWDSGDGVSTSTLWCFAGQCDIGLGQ